MVLHLMNWDQFVPLYSEKPQIVKLKKKKKFNNTLKYNKYDHIQDFSNARFTII